MGLRDRGLSEEAMEAEKVSMEEARGARSSDSSKELDKLSEHDHSSVREEVAGNENTSVETLDKLSNDESDKVRAAVAGNENTSPDTLDKLSNDSSKVSAYIEGNDFKDGEFGEKLISEVVAENPNTSQETLEKLAESNHSIEMSGTDVDDSYDKPVTKEAALNSLAEREIEATASNGENKDMGDLDKADKMADNQKEQGQEKSNDSEVSR